MLRRSGSPVSVRGLFGRCDHGRRAAAGPVACDLAPGFLEIRVVVFRWRVLRSVGRCGLGPALRAVDLWPWHRGHRLRLTQGEGTLISVELCGPHVAISPAMLRPSNTAGVASTSLKHFNLLPPEVAMHIT